MPGALDGDSQLTLVSGAGTGSTAGQDLAALGQITTQLGSILVINALNFIHAEAANLLALAGTHSIVSHFESSYLSIREKILGGSEGEFGVVILQHSKVGRRGGSRCGGLLIAAVRLAVLGLAVGRLGISGLTVTLVKAALTLAVTEGGGRP